MVVQVCGHTSLLKPYIKNKNVPKFTSCYYFFFFYKITVREQDSNER